MEYTAPELEDIEPRRHAPLLAARVAEALPDLLFLYDRETNHYLYTNHAVARWLGYSPEESAEFGDGVAERLLHPEDRASREAIRRTLGEIRVGAVVESRFRLRRADGSWQWLSCREFVFQRGGDGTPRLIGGMVRDWNDQQRSLDRLRLLESAVVHAQDAILITDSGGPDGTTPRVLYVNPAFTEMTGYALDDVVGQQPGIFRRGVADPQVVRTLGSSLRKRQSGRVEMLVPRKDGTTFWAEVAIHPAFGTDGQVTHWVGVQRDITERKRTEDALRRSEERWQLALRGSNDGIFDADLIERTVFLSARCRQFHGYSHRDVVRPLSSLDLWIYPEDRAEYRRVWDEHLAGKTSAFRFEHRTLRKDGSALWVLTRGKCLRSPEGIPMRVTGSVTDITNRKLLEAEREQLLAEALERAERDPLTGLYNYGAFYRRLEVAEAAARSSDRRFAVVLLDVDNFKYFNEAYGHAAGDDVLREVAATLTGATRVDRDAVARLGGDEFALILPDRTRREVALLLADLSAKFRASGYAPSSALAPVPLALTYGWAVFPDDAATVLAALSAADARLLDGKHGSGQLWSDGLRAELSDTVNGFAQLDALVTALDGRDRYTRRHSEEVVFHTVVIADALGLDEVAKRALEIAALTHDVGKIGIPDPILRQPRPLTPDEQGVIRLHPVVGESLVASLLNIPAILPIIRHHHEAWDGTGYPDGLSGESIPLLARVLAVADAYAALIADRPYRKAHSAAEARALIESGSGSQWCPICVAAFRKAN